jgi:riboflavin synthase
MFTGLVQLLGQIEHCERTEISIYCPEIIQRIAIGDSVAVNGVCLTVVKILAHGFLADISPETINSSTLGQRSSYPVNLEMALAVGDKLGGHFVSGHIDGVGTLCESAQQGGSWELSFTAPEQVGRYIIQKGSIAIDGVSLTVAKCNASGTWFSTAVIPHTYHSTNLSSLKPGSNVNLEADMLGKYVEKFLRQGSLGSAKISDKEITPEFLAEHGW